MVTSECEFVTLWGQFRKGAPMEKIFASSCALPYEGGHTPDRSLVVYVTWPGKDVTSRKHVNFDGNLGTMN